MISVSDNENMIIVKNSKFICILRHVDNINDIDDIFDILTESNGWDDATAVTGDVDFGTADDFE